VSKTFRTGTLSLLIVAAIWTAMLAAAIGLIRSYGTKTFPQADEVWALYDAGPGIHIQWLWKTWAEHRIPLAKLIWKSVLQFRGYDFRAGDFLTVLLLAAAALAMMWTARQIRNRVILADAFFPLALLNFGQAQVFLWWWQINHVLAPVIASVILAVLVLRGNKLQRGDAAVIGGGLILFVLCGPGGLPYVVTLSLWLFAWAVLRRQYLPLISSMTMAALALAAFYFVNYKPYFPVNDPPTISSWAPSPGVAASGVASLEILGLSVGTATKPYPVLSGAVVLAFALITAAVLIHVWTKRPEDRWRVSGLIALLAAQAGLVAVIAWSRAGMGLDYIYQGHYLTILAPALCCLYFVWEIRGGRLGRSVQLLMAAVLVVLLPLNFKQAIVTGQGIQQETAAFERDVRAGAPAFILAEHHFASDVVPLVDKLTEILEAHKANRIGIFREIRDDPPYRIARLSLEAAIPDGVTWHNGVAEGKGTLTFTLPEVRHVYALRLRYAYIKSASLWPTLRVYWRNDQVQDFSEERRFASTVSGPDQPTWALIDGKIHTDAKVRSDRILTVWINDPIDQIRIYPDAAPCEFRLSAIEVLKN
jgi:hypothetical protein